MFDVSFGEILIIAVVALLVIGPEKLPKVARTLGLLAGRMQRYVATVKGDIERELKADELRKIHSDVTNEMTALESEMTNEVRKADSTANSILNDIESSAADQKKPGA
ncbi:twin arginine-targeting protein translocase TatB [Methylobacillus sp. MM3]|uniref:Sec-independent protein translocase protein TatB n=1 Tax=Methylobacillus sp. MM3 TaxID=1848039 RepID=UPI0007E12899|nr:Sec-independent protein translocase protein TatB [Methylobacillus sp. MM3]OAJ70707.1 twin arginine-targeting protein translocase TatB [Methylobacillus sp. MM3]